MVTVIVGSNRRDNAGEEFAKILKEMVENTGETCQILSMTIIPATILTVDMYSENGQSSKIKEIQDQYITDADKFIFVVPEYNGSIPGILKLFIDAISVRNYSSNFKNKMSGLIGTATGRAGNLRGLEHLTAILMHMGGLVLPNRLPISSIEQLRGENGQINDAGTLKSMENLVNGLLSF